MRELRFISLRPHDFPDVVDCDGSCGGGGGGAPCLLHTGLCCPDDSLTIVLVGDPDDSNPGGGFTVIDNPDVCADDSVIYTDELLEDLAIAASLPPGRHGGVFFGSESAPDTDAAVMGCRERGACSDDAPRPPAVHAALSDRSCITTTSILETESSPLPLPLPPPPHVSRLVAPRKKLETELLPPPHVSRLAVPRKKRDRSVKRGNRLWSLDIPSVQASHCHGNNPSGGGGGRGKDAGRLRRLLGARPRNRQITQRRACSHCDSTETPQWRAGPDGPGTLCNACGIRYTMHKLLPEYRPSTSPSFRTDKHSNRHRNVVKLRERKVREGIVNMPPAPDSGELMDVCKYIAKEEEER